MPRLHQHMHTNKLVKSHTCRLAVAKAGSLQHSTWNQALCTFLFCCFDLFGGGTSNLLLFWLSLFSVKTVGKFKKRVTDSPVGNSDVNESKNLLLHSKLTCAYDVNILCERIHSWLLWFQFTTLPTCLRKQQKNGQSASLQKTHDGVPGGTGFRQSQLWLWQSLGGVGIKG